MAKIITLETEKRFQCHELKWIGVDKDEGLYSMSSSNNVWERWQALTMQAVYWILEVGGSDDCLDQEDDYEGPDEGSGTKKRGLKAPCGGVKKARKNLKKPAKVHKQPAKKAPAVKAKNRGKL
ncbi:hypothetical protein DFH07DRAFT_776346 [Mycena maculata]|uniref:Uncharacterized protein n=1 Tax=Mycena maculata TaxID=230809 RepID=A0AAD7IM99_9AGAR|nr:hypothetical protein DFH07DRAFT_776346 [Mycena maculata]